MKAFGIPEAFFSFKLKNILNFNNKYQNKNI